MKAAALRSTPPLAIRERGGAVSPVFAPSRQVPDGNFAAPAGGKHRLAQLVDGGVVQRMIPAAAVSGDLDDMRILSNFALDTPMLDMGSTDQPANAGAPQYAVAIANVPTGVSATVALTQTALEGDVRSVYVGPGTHASHYRWLPDAEVLANLLPLTTPANNRLTTVNASARAVDWDHLYLIVSGAIAQRSLAAENEHLADLRRAYALTLDAAELAIRAVINGMPQNGFTTSLAGIAYANAGAAQNDVRARVAAALAGPSQALGGDQTTWAAEYLRLAALTGDRDHQGWHSFGLQSSGFFWNGERYKTLARIGWWLLQQGYVASHYADVINGGTQIGVTPSATVVHF